MNIRIYSLSFLVGSFIFTGCQNSDSNADNNSFDSSIVTKTTISNSTIDSPNPSLQSFDSLGLNKFAAEVATPTNPAHGQPGHKCELAVGAPLNSTTTQKPTVMPVQTVSPISPANITSQPMTIPTKATATTKPVKTLPGMNPPHGEAGHRCDISVGAPLNSPVVKPATTSTVKAGEESKPASPPISTAVQTPTAPGMNPPHGQAGHRCDISVGAPLNSPVVAKKDTTVKH